MDLTRDQHEQEGVLAVRAGAAVAARARGHHEGAGPALEALHAAERAHAPR